MSTDSTTEPVALEGHHETTEENTSVTPDSLASRLPPPRASTLSSLIPRFLKNQVLARQPISSFRGRIPSLRHSLSISSLASPLSLQSGPDPTIVSQRLQDELRETIENEMAVERVRPSSRDSAETVSDSTESVTPVPAETVSGVRWLYANTGMESRVWLPTILP